MKNRGTPAAEQPKQYTPLWFGVLYWLLVTLLPAALFTLSGFALLLYFMWWLYLGYLLVAMLLYIPYRKGIAFILRRQGTRAARVAMVLLMAAPFLLGYGVRAGFYWEGRPVRFDDGIARQLYEDNRETLNRINDTIMGTTRDGVVIEFFSFSREGGITCHTKKTGETAYLPALPLGEVEQLTGEEKALVEDFLRSMTPKRMSCDIMKDEVLLFGVNNIQGKYIKGEKGWGVITIPDGGRRWPNDPEPAMPPDESAIPLDNGS